MKYARKTLIFITWLFYVTTGGDEQRRVCVNRYDQPVWTVN